MALAAISLPRADAEGLRRALPDTLAGLTAEVAAIVGDPGVSEADIVRALGRGLLAAAGAARLPDLATRAELPFGPGQADAPLPADLQHAPVDAFLLPAGGRVRLAPDLAALRRLVPGTPPGRPRFAAVAGGRLHVRPVPREGAVIVIDYHRLPAPLAGPGDKPEGLPPASGRAAACRLCLPGALRAPGGRRGRQEGPGHGLRPTLRGPARRTGRLARPAPDRARGRGHDQRPVWLRGGLAVSREVVLSVCLGLGDAARPGGLVCDPASGRFELAEAVNVDVTAGRIVRRPGYERLGGYGFSDLYSDGAALYGAYRDGLYLIPGQGEPALLRAGLTPNAPMAFVAVAGTVYFANGFENGRIRQGAAEPWAGERYPGPDRIKRYQPPPVGHALAYHAGRIWIAVENCVHFTEGAGLYEWVDGLGGFLPPFAGRVRMLAPAADGLFVGDDAGVVHVAGTDPKKMTFTRVSRSAPIPGSCVSLPAGRHDAAAGQDLGGDAAVWASSDGIHLGLPGASARRIAAAAIPAATRAAAVATRGRYLLFVSL